ncbi:MAG: hypothetical protein CSA33_01860 [Desulfobulbus propionicus]|nr:MAG: hypothetical protein CSA33_01860 [Desulfobulbus propionicus]
MKFQGVGRSKRIRRLFAGSANLLIILSLAGIIELAFFFTESWAHSLFIQSSRYTVRPGASTPLFFCYGHHFPVDGAVRRNKLAWVKVRSPEGKTKRLALRDEQTLHSYLIHYDVEGTWTLTAETTPGYYAIYTDKKGKIRHTLQPLSAFLDTAERVQSSMRSSQWTKTYVTCGTSSTPFPSQVGLPLEIVPLHNPLLLKVGSQLTVQIYTNGEPYQGTGVWDATYNGYSTEAEDMYVQKTTVEGGKFVVPIDHPGRWYVRFFTKKAAPLDKRDRYRTEKRTTTLSFEVRNERRRPRSPSS